ncbi:MAG: nickel-dependent lactate racemase [Acidobacteria bacterium]|nr:nickel-dependent lactate racemase [Acidobacteriota bacterium]
MRIEFSYPGYENIPPADVSNESLMGIYAPAAMAGIDEEAVLRKGFANPIGAPRLCDAVRGRGRLIVLVDDGTRGTPIARLLRHVDEEFRAAAIRDEAVTILTAPGTHREMTENELRRKLGAFYGRYRVRQHHWLEQDELHEFGLTSDGVPVTANRLLAGADFVLGLGAIVPHRVKGFSGGAKIVFPGVSGPEMMERNQWEASLRMSKTVMGVAENPMRLRMQEAARMTGLKQIVNVVTDRDGRIAGCFAGDPVQAHRRGAELSRGIHAARLPRRADIVLADAHPADRDFWQSAKGMYAGTMAVRPGGTLICVAPNPEGVASNHPMLMELGYRPHAELIGMVNRGEVKDIVGAAILADIAQIIDRADCIMASPGISRQETERLGMRWAATPQQALEMAFERQGRLASLAVLRHGGHILPLVEGE